MNHVSEELTNELSELVSKAKRLGYKNIPPRLPKNPTASTMSGFLKRFHNWRHSLQQLEQDRSMQGNKTVVVDSNLLQNYIKK